MLAIGTSGFSYADWKGMFYPDHIKSSDMLPFYATSFATVELNFTYYRMPSARQIMAMAKKTPDTFEFCVKANQILTHDLEVNAMELSNAGHAFCDAMQPLKDRGQLGCVLAQFPWSFRKTQEAMVHLHRLKDILKDLPVVIEFRNNEWVDPSVLEFLRSLSLGYCCVDEPRLKGLMPPMAVCTSEIGYFRFHGRNAKQWWNHEEAYERYDYLYTSDELNEWTEKIQQVTAQADKTFVMFNNHYKAQAVQNAKMMESLLAHKGEVSS